MDEILTRHHSHLFTLRIWREAVGEGQLEWRGQFRHAMSGETRYFRDWSTLVEYLLAMLPEPQRTASDSPTHSAVSTGTASAPPRGPS